MEASLVCGQCQFAGSDVRILGCGCCVHARCVPMGLAATEVLNQSQERSLVPVAANSLLCPLCQKSAVTSLQLLPLSMESLDQAVELRKKAGRQKQLKEAAKQQRVGSDGKQGADQGFIDVQAEASYLLLSHSRGQGMLNGLSSDNDYQRTGRWTEEEIAFVDFLVDSFDKGRLILAQGVRLNDFLCELLLCKASRLTKKMKNARLSIRSYDIHARDPGGKLDVEMLSTLQEKFLRSLSNEATQLEVRFNISRAWRSHFSNFCLQVGSTLLDATQWIASLEMMERRATQAEETIRKARRRRMGLALKTDVKTANNGVFFAGMPVKRPESEKKSTGAQPSFVSSHSSSEFTQNGSSVSSGPAPRTRSPCSSTEGSESDFISNMLDVGTATNPGPGGNILSDDFAAIFSDLLEQRNQDNSDNASRTSSSSAPNMKSTYGSFLGEIVQYMETHDVPFQHVDVWVPSFSSGKNGSGQDDLRLCHAGHATRSDLDPALFCQMHEYGEYSTRFSFAPGVGLPGRVYVTGKYSWERRIDQADPRYFERAGGAKVYGVKTGFGIPLTSSSVLRVVVAMYSVEDLVEDPDVVQRTTQDLSAYCPEPKWKLVVEMGGEGDNKSFPLGVTMPLNQKTPPSVAAHLGLKSEARGSKPEAPRSASVQPTEADIFEEEQAIAALLGDHLPMDDLPTGESTSSTYGAPTMIAPLFMELRFLMLRSPQHRTPEDADMVGMILRSYRGYRKDPNRSPKDLAYLLVRDWKHLRQISKASTDVQQAQPQSMGQMVPHLSQQPTSAFQTTISINNSIARLSQDNQGHQCHVMNAPSSVSTYASSGAPTHMPANFQFVDPTQFGEAGSEGPDAKRRRLMLEALGGGQAGQRG